MAFIDFEGSMGFVDKGMKTPSLDDALAEVNAAFDSIKPKYSDWSTVPAVSSYDNTPAVLPLQDKTPQYDYIGNDTLSLYKDKDGNIYDNGIWYNADGEAWNEAAGMWMKPSDYNDYWKGIIEHENAFSNSPTQQEEIARISKLNQPLPDYAMEHENALRNTYDQGQIQQYQSDKWKYDTAAEHENAFEGTFPGSANQVLRDTLLASGFLPEEIDRLTPEQQQAAADRYNRRQEYWRTTQSGGGLGFDPLGALSLAGKPFQLAQEYVGGPAAQLAWKNPLETASAALNPVGGIQSLGLQIGQHPKESWDAYTTAVQDNKDFLNNENIPWYLKETYYTLTDPLTYASMGISSASKAGELESRIPGLAKVLLDNGDLTTIAAFNYTSGYVTQTDWFQNLAENDPAFAAVVALGAPILGAIGAHGAIAAGKASPDIIRNSPEIANAVADTVMMNKVVKEHPELLSPEAQMKFGHGEMSPLDVAREQISNQWMAARLAAGFAIEKPGAVLDALGNAVKDGLMSPIRGAEILGDALANVTKDPSIQAIKQGLIAGLSVPVTGIPAMKGRIPRELKIGDLEDPAVLRPVKEALAAHNVENRTWFHTTKNPEFSLPDPEAGVGTSTGITQGPGIYLAADPGRSNKYGTRQFGSHFTGNVGDLTARVRPNEAFDAAGKVSWADVRDAIIERIAKIADPADGPPGPLNQKNIKAYLDNIAKSLDPNRVKMNAETVPEMVAREINAAKAKEGDFSGYNLRHSLSVAVERLMYDLYDSDIILSHRNQATDELFGRFAGVVEKDTGMPHQVARDMSLSMINDVLAEKGVDAIYHHSPMHDGDVLVVLNGDKLKVGSEVNITKGSIAAAASAPFQAFENQSHPTTFRDYLKNMAAKVLVAGASKDPYTPDMIRNGTLNMVPSGEVVVQTADGKQVTLPFRLEEDLRGWYVFDKYHRPWGAAIDYVTKQQALDSIKKNVDWWLLPPEKTVTMKLFGEAIDPEDVTEAMHAFIGLAPDMGLKQAIFAVPGFAAGVAHAPDDASPTEKLFYGLGGMAMAVAGVNILDKAHERLTRMPKERVGPVVESPRPFDEYGNPAIGPQPVMVSSALGEIHPERALRGIEAFKAALNSTYDTVGKLWQGSDYTPRHWGDKEIRQMFQEAQRLRKVASSTAAMDREKTLAITRGLGVGSDGIVTSVTRDVTNRAKIEHALNYGETAVASGYLTRTQVNAIKDLENVLGYQTVQDIAAKFDTWKKSGLLSKEQIDLIEELRTMQGPYQALKQSLPGVTSGDVRVDIEPGGFYLPRGTADKISGEELEPRIRGHAFNQVTAGKDSSQRRVVFTESMGEGIRNGYQYKPLHEVIESHAQWTMEKAVLDFVTKQVLSATDESGARLAQSSYRVNQEIKDIWAAGRRELNKLVSQVNRIERSTSIDKARLQEAERAQGHVTTARGKASALGESLREEPMTRVDTAAGPVRIKLPASPKNLTTADGVERGIAYFDTAINRIEKRIATLEARGDKNVTQLTALKAELEAFKTNSKEFRGKWEQAKKDAYTRPAGRDTISSLAGLQNVDFPREYANAIQRGVDDFLARKPLGKLDKFVETVNGTLRAVRATADVSFMGIQGLLGIATDPVAYLEAWGTAMHTLADPAVMGKFMREYDAAAKPGFTLSDFAKDGLVIQGPNEGEFTVHRNPLTTFRGHSLSNAPIIAQSNRAFTTFATALRINMYKNALETQAAMGRELTPAFRQELATSINRLSGHADRRFGGVVGSAAMFAPRFFESQIETVAKAFMDDGIQGEMARASLLKTLGLGVMLTYAINEATGRDTIFDPTDSNFMRIRDAAGVDISVFGPWDSLVRGMVKALPVAQSTDGSLEIKDLGRWATDASQLMRSKGSPLVSVIWDLWTGKNYIGEKASITDPSYWARAVMPLSVSDVPFNPKDWDKETAVKTGVGISGVKATPLTKTETALREEWNNGNLLKDNQFVKKQPARLSDLDPLTSRRIKDKYVAVDEEVKKRYPESLLRDLDTVATNLGAADSMFRAGVDKDGKPYTVAQWKTVWATQMRDQARAYEKEFSQDGKVPDDPNNPRRWIEDWYSTFKKAAKPDGQIDSQYLAELQAPIIDNLKSIPWYDNLSGQTKNAYDYVQEYSLEGKSEPRRKYLEAMRTLSDAGYFDTPQHVGLDKQQERDFKDVRTFAQNAMFDPAISEKYPSSKFASEGDRLATYVFDQKIAEGMPRDEAIRYAYYVKYVAQAPNNPAYLKIKNDPNLQDELLWLNDTATWQGILGASAK